MTQAQAEEKKRRRRTEEKREEQQHTGEARQKVEEQHDKKEVKRLRETYLEEEGCEQSSCELNSAV